MKKEPEGIAKHYLDFVANGAPKCCHTCENYQDNGVCYAYQKEPPQEFTNQIGVCEQWLYQIPF